MVEEHNSISRANIPTSFVFKPMKTVQDNHEGEAKLYFGRSSDIPFFMSFFNYQDASNIYTFEKKNLIEYLDLMRGEFSSGKYKFADENYRLSLLGELVNLDDEDLKFNLITYADDQNRFYIRSDKLRGDGWFLLRRMAVPLLSELEIIKFPKEGGEEFRFYLWKSDEPRRRAHTRKGDDTGLELPSRYVPEGLKRRIYRRDRNMCQANYIIDPKLDKNTMEICGRKPCEIDHIEPHWRGGPTTYANLQLLCKYHNRKKSGKVYPALKQRT